MSPPGDLEEEHHLGLRVVAVVGRGAARMVVDRHAELFAGLPDRVVVGRVERRDARPGRRSGKQDSATESCFGRPADLLDGRVDVVEHDLRDARPLSRCLGAEVGEPAVVCLEAGPAPLEITGTVGRRLVQQADRGEERRNRVGEDDLAHHAVGLHLGQATVGIPVALGVVALEVLVGIVEGLHPRIEVVVVLRCEVRPVRADAGAAVAVGADDDVTVAGGES